MGEEYHHQKDPIPIIMKPIYNRLESQHLLKKYLGGYTQNANEALHQLVWKFCPKVLFLGAAAVKCGAALAVYHYNDGVSSFYHFASSLGCQPDDKVLVSKDKRRVKRNIYKDSLKAKNLRKQCRKRRKGFKREEEEGLMYHHYYAPGMDGLENCEKSSSKRPKKS